MAAKLLIAGPARHWAEEIVAQDVAAALPDDWRVVRSSSLVDRFGNSRDLDVTVIGPPGVVIVVVEHRTGKLTCRPGMPWLRELPGDAERREERNPLPALIEKEKAFHTHLCEDLGLPHASVFGVVALYGKDYEIANASGVRARVHAAEKLPRLLLERRLVTRKANVRQLTQPDVAKIAESLRAASKGTP